MPASWTLTQVADAAAAASKALGEGRPLPEKFSPSPAEPETSPLKKKQPPPNPTRLSREENEDFSLSLSLTEAINEVLPGFQNKRAGTRCGLLCRMPSIPEAHTAAHGQPPRPVSGPLRTASVSQQASGVGRAAPRSPESPEPQRGKSLRPRRRRPIPEQGLLASFGSPVGSRAGVLGALRLRSRCVTRSEEQPLCASPGSKNSAPRY